MAQFEDDQIAARIRAHAFNALSAADRPLVNLYLDHKTYSKGERIGPAFQKLVAPKPSILVFADDNPLANFGHDCRYILYDPKTAEPHTVLPARFPPFATSKPETLKPFHEPVRVQPVSSFRIWPIWRCPIIIPDGERYAVLYSGMSNMRHLNDLEFCYRMLIDRYAFKPGNIFVLNYDGTLNTQDGHGVTWPGDSTAYRIQVTGQGNRAGFQAALNAIKPRIQARDLLFIHTNNHGDNFGAGSFLCTYPAWGTYTSTDFCADLHGLPHYRSLIVMMEQCNAGGFNTPVIAASTADNTSIASAATATQSSYASPDGHWDSFARDWIAAQAGHDPYGAALSFNPDTNGDGAIESTEAFSYANTVKNPYDTPNYNQSSAAGGDISLSQKYILYWWWCWIWWQLIAKYRVAGPVPYPGPGPEFQEAIASILPDMQKLILPMLDRNAVELRRKIAPQLEASLVRAFQQSDSPRLQSKLASRKRPAATKRRTKPRGTGR